MKLTRLRAGVTALVLAATAISLTACGSDNATGKTDSAPAAKSNLSGSLAGAGASSQESAMKAWQAGFQAKNSGVTVTYDPVGSGAGITQFLGKQVAFAGSDAALEGDEVAKAKERCGADAFDLPVYISPVAVVFNLEGITSLNMKADVIAKIFRGEITKWNDPAIAADNPDAKLPDLAITPVHRADKSGTTENFTDYLHVAAPNVWTDKASKSWPVQGGESGDKTSGMIQVVQSGQGTIGYADASQVGSLGTVALPAGGSFVKYSAEAAAKAADASPLVEGRPDGDLALKLNRTPDDPSAYPLVLVSYHVVCSKYDAKEGELVKAFVSYVISEEAQKAAADAAGSAPLSADMRGRIEASLNKIQVG